MVHLDHLTLFVRDNRAAARWYVQNLAFEIEFETPDGETTGVRDDSDFTIFLTTRTSGPADAPRCILYFEMDDVDVEHRRLASNGVDTVHGPQDNSWGYGSELRDLDGHLIRLWDRRSVT
jgi:predicted enzyme related to lactoylglutathione lyase